MRIPDHLTSLLRSLCTGQEATVRIGHGTMDWLDLLAVHGTLKSLLHTTVQRHQFLSAQPSLWSHSLHPYMTTGRTIALTRWTFVGKVMSLVFNMLSRSVIAFLPRSKHLLISRLQSPCSDLGAEESKAYHCFHCFPIYLP